MDEMEKCEKQLYECALVVEQDNVLHNDMKEWDGTVADGLGDEPWQLTK